MKPTHYICCRCKANFYIVTDRRKRYICKGCNQEYELVPTKYGGVMVLIGGKDKEDKSEQLDMF